VGDAVPFCPACGAPQIRVASREPKPAETGDSAAIPPPPPDVVILPAQHGFVAASQIQWKPFLRLALALAPAVGLVVISVFPVGCLLLAGAVVWAIHRYRLRWPGPLQRAQAAKLGALLGLLSFGFAMIFFGIGVGLDPSGYRQSVEKVLQDALARSTNPDAQRAAQALFSGPNGIVLATIMGLGFLLVLVLLISATTGALSVNVDRNRPRL
jgi:hypothetical protein